MKATATSIRQAIWTFSIPPCLSSTVTMYVPENGSHYNCFTVKVGNLTARGRKPFSFNASEYTIEELATKKHNYELEKAGCVVVCTDYKQSGVGSNSCGPQLLPQYRFDEEEFVWEMLYCFE